MTDCLCLRKRKLASLAIWKMARMQQSHIIGHNASQIKQKMLPDIIDSPYNTPGKKNPDQNICNHQHSKSFNTRYIHRNIQKLPMSPEH